MNQSIELTATAAMAQHGAYNPWSLPDSFTVFAFAPEDIRGFLHPHWHTQKSPHPMLYYFFGLYYLVMGAYIYIICVSHIPLFCLCNMLNCDFLNCPLYKLKFAGSIAIFGNIIVLRIFSNNQALRTPANMLVMNLAMSDLLLMITLIPECVYNFFLGGPWQFGELGCQIHSFCGIFLYYILFLSSLIAFKFAYTQSTGALMGYNQIMTLTVSLFSYIKLTQFYVALFIRISPLHYFI